MFCSSSKTVPQRVRRHPLLDLGHAGGEMNGAIELPRRHRQHRITAGEQPDRRPGDTFSATTSETRRPAP
jgi:hypothetical protein